MKKVFALSVTFTVAVVTPAFAFQCPKLVQQINATAGNRFDAAAAAARADTATVAKLHSEGKHAESEKAAKETLAKLGVK